MKIDIRTAALLVGTISLVLFPALALAQTGLIPCSGTDCDFDDLVTLVKNVINFLLFKIAAPLAAVMFAYAGFLYLSNRGNEGQVKQAHEIFWYVFWGLVVALGAWILINFILTFFLGAASPFNFLTP